MKESSMFKSLILPVMSLIMVLVIVALWLSQRVAMVDQAQRQQQQLQAELTALNQKITQTAQDEQWITQYLAEYRRLQRTGFVGNDQRLAWNQILIEESSKLGLKDVSFDIEPQKPHQPDAMVGTLTLMDTAVQFNASVPHEGVFAQLLDDLRKREPGIFTVRECALSHVAGLQPLQVQCVFVWHTLAPGAAA